MKEIFCDGIADIVFTHGLILIDFFHFIPWKNDPVEQVPFLRLTLPLNGFLRVFEAGSDLLNQLTNAGVIVVTPASPKKDAAPAGKKKAGKNDAKAVPAKKAEAPAKKVAPAPAKKAEAPAKPVAKPSPAKKAAPAPAQKSGKGKKPAK